MSERNKVFQAAIAGMIALGLAQAAAAQDAKNAPKEKCYGVAKAGKNDCQTSTHSCAGTATADASGDSWIYVPKGTCDKIAGGSLEPKA